MENKAKHIQCGCNAMFDTLGCIRHQVTKWKQQFLRSSMWNTDKSLNTTKDAKKEKKKFFANLASKTLKEQHGRCLRHRVTCSILGDQSLR